VAAPISAAEAKTIVQRVQRTFGTTPTLVGAGTVAMGRPGQREQVAIVNDVSGSMEEEYDPGITKLQASIRASVNLVLGKFQTDPQDEIGLVVFNSVAEVIEDFHPVGTYKARMIYALQSLKPEDGTDINEGLKAAQGMFDWSLHGVVRRVVLLTDGQGGDPLDTARELKARGVVVDVVGVGDKSDNVDEVLLKKVASTVGGVLRYRFIKDQKTLVAHYTQLANKTATA
jgi:Mg-chelatase subunit ChlD